VDAQRPSSARFSPSDFPVTPTGWSFFCSERELSNGPVGISYADRHLVAFRTGSGRIGILEGYCSHTGADLALGRVVEECLECPFHNWRYALDGKCAAVPYSTAIPPFARQRNYPSAVREGLVFMWNGTTPQYPLPFFADLEPEECVWAGPHNFLLSCPWYLVGANSFDTQHLYSVHERELQAPPAIWSEGDHALASRTITRVGNDRWYDRFIRAVCGPESTMTAVNWSGSLILVTAHFRRTKTYGMVSLRPLTNDGVLVQVFAWLPRSGSRVLRTLDSLSASVRLMLIRRFVKDDVALLNKIRAVRLNLVEADRELARYFQWISGTNRESDDQTRAVQDPLAHTAFQPEVVAGNSKK